MLILRRRYDQRVRLRAGPYEIWITVTGLDCERGRVHLGFDAPRAVEIDREEIIRPDDREERRA